MFPFANAHLLLWSRSVLLKDHVDLQPVVQKEGGTKDFRFDEFACRWKQRLKVALPRNESYELFYLSIQAYVA